MILVRGDSRPYDFVILMFFLHVNFIYLSVFLIYVVYHVRSRLFLEAAEGFHMVARNVDSIVCSIYFFSDHSVLEYF